MSHRAPLARTQADDLQLAHLGHGLPLLHRAAGRRNVGEGRARLERRAVAGEVEALVAVLDGELVARRHQPAGEGGHRDAPVLKLGVAEPGESGRRAEVGQAKRVPDDVARLLSGALPAERE